MALPQWMKDDLGFSDEELAQIEPRFTPERAKKLDEGYMRRQDYSRKMDESRADLKRQQDELAIANQRLTDEWTDFATNKARGDEATNAQIASLEQAQADVLRLQQVVHRVATQYGFDPAPILSQTVTKPAEKPAEKTPAFDTSQYVDRETLSKFAVASARLPAEIMRIAQEHQQLTGEILDPTALMDEWQTRANRPAASRGSMDLRDIWSEMHAIPEKRQAAEKKKFDDAIAEAEQRGRLAARTEHSIPGAAPAGRMSPVFKNADGTARASVLQRGQPMGSTQRAAASLVRIRAEQQAARAGGKT